MRTPGANWCEEEGREEVDMVSHQFHPSSNFIELCVRGAGALGFGTKSGLCDAKYQKAITKTQVILSTM